MDEILLATLPCENDQQRISVVLCRRSVVSGENADQSLIQLRTESYSPDVGWFTQSRIELTPQQLQALRQTMGMACCALRSCGSQENPRNSDVCEQRNVIPFRQISAIA
ncbi:MAG: hypothetical protein AAFP90_04895 [Planctomycetota bacterium]